MKIRFIRRQVASAAAALAVSTFFVGAAVGPALSQSSQGLTETRLEAAVF